MSESVGVALIGYGLAGRVFHAPLITCAEGLSLCAIVSSRHEQIAADYPGARVATLDEVLDDAAIELVVVATPNDSHVAIASQALERGKHVVIDKPFTTTVAEAETLIDLAGHHARLLSVFQNRRWDADFLAVKALIESGELGQLKLFESTYNKHRPHVSAHWREHPGPGAGQWFNLGPHVGDQALALFGLPRGVHADLAAQREGSRTTDYFHVQLRYDTHRVILRGSMVAPAEMPRFVLHGTRASYLKYGMDTQEAALKAGDLPVHAAFGLDPVAGQLVVPGEQGYQRRDVPTPRGNYLHYYRAIAAALRGNGVNPVPPEQARDVMRLLEAAERSAETGCEVAMSV